jgi:hypothetical protein
MAKYLILIYGDEKRWAGRTPSEREALSAGHRAFAEAAAAAGVAVLAGEELAEAATATTLRMNGPTDGPFLETKEALGGFYLVEAPDLDAVMALARRLPEVGDDHSGVEIRPVGTHE